MLKLLTKLDVSVVMDTVHVWVTKHLIAQFTRVATLEMLCTRLCKSSFLLFELVGASLNQTKTCLLLCPS